MTRDKRNLRDGLLFLAPNIAGFLAFTAFPLVFSLVLAFSNYDLKLHNSFKPEGRLRFVGFENFTALLRDADFWKFLSNTFFLMIGMPFAIAASLLSAILLSKDLRGGRRVWAALVERGRVESWCKNDAGAGPEFPAARRPAKRRNDSRV